MGAFPPDCHGRPRNPSAVSVSGGGTWNRLDFRKSGQSSDGPVPNLQLLGGGTHHTEVHWIGLHSFLSHLASGIDPVPGFEKLCLLGVDWEGTVHLMHLLFSIPVDLYSTSRRLFACIGKLPDEYLPAMDNIPMEFFAIRCAVHAVPQADHVSHLREVTHFTWKLVPYKRAVKILSRVFYLSCQGITFVPTDGTPRLLLPSLTIG